MGHASLLPAQARRGTPSSGADVGEGLARTGAWSTPTSSFEAFDDLYACDLSVFSPSLAANPGLTLGSAGHAGAPRVEAGRKGQDYDVVLRFRRLTIPIEVKAKADDTELSQGTVIQTIRGAAQQLPKGQKGVVFMRTPNAWIGRQLEQLYNDWLREATRQTSRIGTVVTAIDKPHLNEAGTQGHVDGHHDFFRHPDCPDELWEYCLWLKESLDLDRTHLAPMPPF